MPYSCARQALQLSLAMIAASAAYTASAADGSLMGVNLWSDGNILQTVQNNHVFADNKHFVDKPLSVTPSQAHADFAKLRPGPRGYTNSTLIKYLQADFLPAGSDLTAKQAPDFKAEPSDFLSGVTDASIRQWALDVHALWGVLYRVESDSVRQHPERHSLLNVPNPAVVPGARFREIYYWDTYWILKGLLVSSMHTTARGMVRNLAYLVTTHGHVPNGARTYYLNRSQPPLLSAMVKLVYGATKDRSLLVDTYPALVAEHGYWTRPPKQLTVRSGAARHHLAQYHAEWTLPRPESYTQDVAAAAGMSDADKEKLFTNLASAAESGWDFSSRWLGDGNTLATCRTTDIIPVDLNAYLYAMEMNLAEFAAALGHSPAAASYTRAAAARAAAIKDLMYSEAAGQWHDLIITNRFGDDTVSAQQTGGVFISNYIPLWVGLVKPNSVEALSAVRAFKASGLLGLAGVATSLSNSTQQWDYPNAWPPLQDILIESFETTGGLEGKALAASIAQRWLRTMYSTWSTPGRLFHKMVEKWDATTIGKSGGGGEYAVQIGFGWSNGVMLSLLDRYGWNPKAE